jgi:hypothetical protein
MITAPSSRLKGIRSLELGSRTSLFGQPKDETDEAHCAAAPAVIPGDRRMGAGRARARLDDGADPRADQDRSWFLADSPHPGDGQRVKAQGKDALCRSACAT